MKINRRKLSLIVGVVTLAVVLPTVGWYLFKNVIVYPRTATVRMTFDRMPDWVDDRKNPLRNTRTVATVFTCFTDHTFVDTALYFIDDGEIDSLATHSAHRGNLRNRPDAPRLMRLRLMYGLGDQELPSNDPDFVDQPVGTLIVQVGTPSAARMTKRGHQPLTVSSRETLPGTAEPGITYLMYVEGNQKPHVNREMSLEQFARLNQGQYLVMTMRLTRVDQ